MVESLLCKCKALSSNSNHTKKVNYFYCSFLKMHHCRLVMVAFTIILATQEAVIRRIEVQSQPWKKVSKAPSQPTSQVLWFTSVISAMQKA
jgi:hypothetical protein